MPAGPGIYDNLCTLVRERTEAESVMIAVVNGINGTGFSVQTSDPIFGIELADRLEHIAKEIRKSIQNA